MAELFFNVFEPESVALTVFVISAVAASGLWLGSFKLKGVSLGIAGVMFTGLTIGQLLGPGKMNAEVLNFARDFGLIVFVYAVGVQVGPGFFATLRRSGLKLNLLAAAIVLLGAVVCVVMAKVGLVDVRTAVGLFAGATTNAPSIGSAVEALKTLHGAAGLEQARTLTTPAFAIAYPFGLLGVILAMVALKALFRVNPLAEADRLEHAERRHKPDLAAVNVELKNPNFDGLALERIPAVARTNVVISRVKHGDTVSVARPETTVAVGDVLLAVGPREEIGDFQMVVGAESKVDLRTVPSNIKTRVVTVTHAEVLGKTVDELDLPSRLGVAVTRVSRAGLEFTAVGDLSLQFGDSVRVVGETDALDAAARELGDSVRELNHPRLLPIFVGILLGVTLGSIPVAVPGLPAPLKLGLAAGPMIVAILLARVGRVGGLIYYMPNSASQLLRELGITLFLIAVGLSAAPGFFGALRGPAGVQWLAYGAVVTLVPLLAVGLIARKVYKINYLHVCGLLCGSMTSPSLAFTHTMTHSEAPAVAFATVYPLTMILRVLVAQVLVLVFAR